MVTNTKSVARKPQDDDEDEDEDMVFHVYPEVDNDEGSVELDDVVGETCCDIEEIAASGKMNEANLARYQIITELMATPLCKLNEKFEELLHKILEEEMEAGYTEVFGEVGDEATENACGALPNGRAASDTTNGIAINTAEEDISDEELVAELRAAEERALAAKKYTDEVDEAWQFAGGY